MTLLSISIIDDATGSKLPCKVRLLNSFEEFLSPSDSIKNPVPDDEPQPIEYSEEELGRQVDTVRMPGGGNVRIPRNPRGVYPVPDVEEDPKGTL